MKRVLGSKKVKWVRLTIKRHAKKIRRSKQDKRSLIFDTEVKAPAILSFTKNASQTLSFFDTFKNAALIVEKRKHRGKFRSRNVFLNLNAVRQISVPCAVILSAELHRWSLSKQNQGAALRVRNHKRWDPRVRELLSSLGSMQLLDIGRKISPAERENREVVLLRLRSGDKADGESLAALQTDLADLSKIFEPKPYVFEGLGEAAENSISHAYTGTSKPKYPYVGYRWWATSCYDTTNETVRFFVYDQGVGIAQTIRESQEWQGPLASFLQEVDSWKSDANVMESAFAIGATRTRKSERGKGLAKMAEVVVKAGAGRLRIISGEGEILFGADSKIVKRVLPRSVGGTLVEWSIPIATFSNARKSHD